MKRTMEPRGVLLPEALRQGLDNLLALFRRGGSPSERDQAVTALQAAFLHAVSKGHITLAQERLFAARLHAICAPVDAEMAKAVLPAWRQPTTDEISIN